MIQQIRLFGREEDAADQFSAYIMLRLDKEESDQAAVMARGIRRSLQPPGFHHEKHSGSPGAEGFHSLEGNMCGTAMRGADALPGSKATSRAKGLYRNLGDLMSGGRRHLLCEYGGPHHLRRRARTGLRARVACQRRWSVYGDLCRYPPEAGAVCGKAARTDLVQRG